MASSIPADQRAGTRLTADPSKRIAIFFVDKLKGTTQHGTVDLEHHFYQCGGQFSDFHFRKKDWITLPYEVWQQLQHHEDYVRWLEWHDREENRAYVVSWEDAQTGQVYNAGIGFRWGIPRTLFAVE